MPKDKPVSKSGSDGGEAPPPTSALQVGGKKRETRKGSTRVPIGEQCIPAAEVGLGPTRTPIGENETGADSGRGKVLSVESRENLRESFGAFLTAELAALQTRVLARHEEMLLGGHAQAQERQRSNALNLPLHTDGKKRDRTSAVTNHASSLAGAGASSEHAMPIVPCGPVSCSFESERSNATNSMSAELAPVSKLTGEDRRLSRRGESISFLGMLGSAYKPSSIRTSTASRVQNSQQSSDKVEDSQSASLQSVSQSLRMSSLSPGPGEPLSTLTTADERALEESQDCWAPQSLTSSYADQDEGANDESEQNSKSNKSRANIRFHSEQAMASEMPDEDVESNSSGGGNAARLRHDSNDDADSEGSSSPFAVHGTWLAQVKSFTTTTVEAIALASQQGQAAALADMAFEEEKTTKRMWDKIIVNPGHSGRIAWDLASLVMMAYECTILPLSFFELSSEGALGAINMVARLYWTIDLPLQFITGYQTRDGDVEMRLKLVMRNYARTWFSMDLFLILVDWAEFLSGGGKGVQATRVAKAAKSLRMLRLTRMMKLLYITRRRHLPESVKYFFYRFFDAEVISGLVMILRIFLFWVWLNHVCCCIWYGIAVDDAAGLSDDVSWIVKSNLEGVSKLYCYVASFQWSLSLYSSSTDIYPSSLAERAYAILSTLVAFMASAYLISTMTTSMTRLSIATAQEAQHFSNLKQYLFENAISPQTSERVQRNARHALQERKRMKSEKDIALLDLISHPLRVELHFEIYGPVLGWQPFLDILSEESSNFMRQVCHKALAKMTLAHQDLLFDEGEASLHQQMYFVIEGDFSYKRRRKPEVEIVRMGEWACEAVLWTKWRHCGAMWASQESTLLALESEPFQHLASQFRDCTGYAQRYAVAFCKYLEECDEEDLTDLEDKDMDTEWLASKARTVPAAHQASELKGSPSFTMMVGKAFPPRSSATNLVKNLRLSKSRSRTSSASNVGTGRNTTRKSFVEEVIHERQEGDEESQASEGQDAECLSSSSGESESSDQERPTNFRPPGMIVRIQAPDSSSPRL